MIDVDVVDGVENVFSTMWLRLVLYVKRVNKLAIGTNNTHYMCTESVPNTCCMAPFAAASFISTSKIA